MRYEEVRPLVKNGDVVFFSSHRSLGDWLIKQWSELVVKGLTKGVYSHVGQAYWLGPRLFLLEASFEGGVRMVPMSMRQPDKIVEMKLNWGSPTESVAFENMGKKYGKWEAVSAGLGMRELHNNEFICTEYVADICEAGGYYFPKVKQLPDIFYNQVLQDKKAIWTVDNPVLVIK
jgi:hypothetical protein